MFATAFTWLRVFSGPCMYLAVAAGLFAAIPASCVTKKLTEGRALKAEASLASYQAAVATRTAEALTVALKGQRDAWERERQEQAAIRGDIQTGNAAVIGQMEGLRRDITRQLSASLAAPEWACLQRPLPDDFGGLFSDPGT